VLAKVAQVVEAAGLQVGVFGLDLRESRLGQDVGGDVLYQGTGDFVDEA
jgi:hypothetical protein